jgi:hypothetical protein
MVLEPDVLSLNFIFVDSHLFKLNIAHVVSHMLKWSLSSHVRESIEVLIKYINHFHFFKKIFI